MTTLHNLTIKKFHEGLRLKDFSALEITKAYLDHIDARDSEIGAYLSLSAKEALLQAEQADLVLARGENLAPLAGVPFGIKDAILVQGEPATSGSKILADYRAAYDATVTSKMRLSGAVFLGKTNMDEFAMGSSTENSAFKKTKNPHDTSRVPGGSSGGSAAAVAAHMALAALGSDTGGSIRQPAAFCGVVGLKPTYGAVSRYGLTAMASSLDQIGPITRTVADAGIVFRAIAGRDVKDATTADVSYSAEDFEPNFEKLRNMTFGLPDEYFIDGLATSVREAIDRVVQIYNSFGVKFKKISLPHTRYALSDYYIIMPAEVSANLARFDGLRYAPVSGVDRHSKLEELYVANRSQGFGREAKRRIILGTFVLSSGYYDAYYGKAQKVRRLIKNDFLEAFRGVDLILAPTTPTPAFKLGEKVEDPLAMYLSDVFTIPASLAGIPAISIPAALSPGDLPIAFQLMAPHFGEAKLINAGNYYEQAVSGQAI